MPKVAAAHRGSTEIKRAPVRLRAFLRKWPSPDVREGVRIPVCKHERVLISLFSPLLPRSPELGTTFVSFQALLEDLRAFLRHPAPVIPGTRVRLPDAYHPEVLPE